MRRQTSRKNNRRARTIITWSVITTISFASIAGYAALSIMLNGPAPYWNFNGMAFVVQPTSESTIDTVQLGIIAYPSRGYTGIGYFISACGPRPYTADLVLTGDARIAPVTGIPGAKPPEFPQVQESSDSFYGDIQVARIDLPKAPCPIMNFEETNVGGDLYGQVQRNFTGLWGLWNGPHASQSWPQLGLTSDPTAYESFTLAGIAGKLIPPRSLSIAVQEPPFPGWSIDSSLPSTPTRDDSPDTPSWSGANEISPSAQLTDIPSVALLQDWIVVFAIGFGIGGAMLASLAFDWIRPGEPRVGSSDQRGLTGSGTPIGRVAHPNRTKRQAPIRIILLGLAVIVGYARRRQRRRQ
jgi:hypothetical protein